MYFINLVKDDSAPYLFYHKTNENANVYSENLFDFSLDKQMFVHYDTDIQTAVRNKCSHVMEGVYEKQKKKGKAEISFFDRIINGTIYNNVFRMFWYDPGTGG